MDGVVRTGFSAKPSFSIVDNDGINPAEPIRMDATTPDALRQMLAQPWGQQAYNHAKALGINPAALAATALIESTFRNKATPDQLKKGYGAMGFFQMEKPAYIDGINQVMKVNPALYAHLMQQDSIAGRMNPDVESAAAAGYMLYLVHGLQRNGISNPTFLDLRGVYNYGIADGSALARARDEQLLKDIITIKSHLESNKIPPQETVGQWRSRVKSEVNAANAEMHVLQ